MRRKPAFEAFAPIILEVYHRDEEAFWAAVMAPFDSKHVAPHTSALDDLPVEPLSP